MQGQHREEEDSRVCSHGFLSLHSSPVGEQFSVVLGICSAPQLLWDGHQAVPHQEDAGNQAKCVGGSNTEAKHIAGCQISGHEQQQQTGNTQSL